MWDCKTSKMSQSPHAALNAFGLFAGGPERESKANTLAAWRPKERPTARVLIAFRRRGASRRGYERGDLNRSAPGNSGDSGRGFALITASRSSPTTAS